LEREALFYSNLNLPELWGRLRSDGTTGDETNTGEHNPNKRNQRNRAGTLENEEGKPLPTPVLYKGLFSPIGIEPTFYPDQFWNMKWGEVKKSTDIRHKINHPWMDKAYVDDKVLEIPSTVYDDVAELEKDYKSLLRKLKRENYSPSSKLSMSCQGNCHLNYDLGEDISLYINLAAFLNNYPALVWAFITGNDRRSSNIYERMCEDDPYTSSFKGMCINLQNKEGKSMYKWNLGDCKLIPSECIIEMRFFHMPRNIGEFRLHINFANAILRHVAGHKYKFKLKQEDFKAFTYEEALKNLNQALKLIGMEKEFPSYKLKELKRRFNLGKKFLV